MFNKDWALVSAGDLDDFDTCTIGWGSLGDIWGGINKGRPIVTVYVNPTRYTNDYNPCRRESPLLQWRDERRIILVEIISSICMYMI